MNIKTNSNTKTTAIIAILSVAMITSAILGSVSIQNFQQYVMGQINKEYKAESPGEYKNISLATNNSTTSSNDTSATVVVNPAKSTTKEFWINTVHFDGMTNINAGV